MPACSHPKRLHATRDDALAHVKALLWRNNVEGHQERSKGLGVYPCDESPGWHVGHAKTAPPVWHYTLGCKLDAILKADKLRVPREVDRKRRSGGAVNSKKWEPEPLLWFSRNQEWEWSVFKAARIQWGERHKWRTVNEVVGQGLVRFAVPAVYAKLRWSDYLARNPMSWAERDVMALYGNPTEWLATDEDVPLDLCSRAGDSGIQVFYRGKWINAADVDEAAYEQYLSTRVDAYATAEATLEAKVLGMTEKGTLGLTVDEWLIAEDIERSALLREGIEAIRERLKKAQKQAQK